MRSLTFDLILSRAAFQVENKVALRLLANSLRTSKALSRLKHLTIRIQPKDADNFNFGHYLDVCLAAIETIAPDSPVCCSTYISS